MHGFLRTAASFGSDLNLIVQVLMGVLLVIGALLARAKHFRAHAACMTGVLLLNLVMILVVMWAPFQEVVLGGIATHFGSRYERIAAIHGVLGLFAEVFGCYILSVAATTRFQKDGDFDDGSCGCGSNFLHGGLSCWRA